MNSIRWRKSNVSGYEDCVEVGHTLRVVRDSKNPAGPTLAADVDGLLAAIRRGDLVGYSKADGQVRGLASPA